MNLKFYTYYISSKQLTNNRSTPLTSDSGEDLLTSAKIADSIKTYFQSVFVKDKTVDEGLSHFTHRPVLVATMMGMTDLHWKLYIEKFKTER